MSFRSIYQENLAKSISGY